MIGLVAGKSAVERIVGIHPLSPWLARGIKAREFVKGNAWAFGVLSPPLFFVAAGALMAQLGATATGAVLAVTGAVVFALALWELASDEHDLVSRWAVADVVSGPFGYAHYHYFRDTWGTRHYLPADALAIFGKLKAAGLTAQVEYFDEDPFLFVTVAGKRVYLAHWD